MHRLFVALPLPAALRAVCLDTMQTALPGWRWQSAEQLHLTLRFIGEVERRMAEDIADALDPLRGAALALHFDGVGWFDQGPGGILFARAEPRAALAALHAKVDRLLLKAGVAPDRRSFLPHVTLARGRPHAAAPHEWLERHAGLASAAAAADRVNLLESALARTGAFYEVVHSYTLDKG